MSPNRSRYLSDRPPDSNCVLITVRQHLLPPGEVCPTSFPQSGVGCSTLLRYHHQRLYPGPIRQQLDRNHCSPGHRRNDPLRRHREQFQCHPKPATGISLLHSLWGQPWCFGRKADSGGCRSGGCQSRNRSDPANCIGSNTYPKHTTTIA